MNEYSVYLLLDPTKPMFFVYNDMLIDTQPFYVGITKLLKRRMEHHKFVRRGKGYKEPIIDTLTKKGKTFETYVYDSNLSFEKAVAIEKELIAHFGRLDLANGILGNMTNGGSGLLECKKSKTTLLKHRHSMHNIYTPLYINALSKWRGYFEYLKGYTRSYTPALHWCVIHGKVKAIPGYVKKALIDGRVPCPKCSRHIVSGINIARKINGYTPFNPTPKQLVRLARSPSYFELMKEVRT